jgi:hypothetical protein
MVNGVCTELVCATSESLVVHICHELRALVLRSESVPCEPARCAHLNLAIRDSRVSIERIYCYAKRVRGIGSSERQLGRLRVEAQRDAQRGRGLALVGRGIFEPDI